MKAFYNREDAIDFAMNNPDNRFVYTTKLKAYDNKDEHMLVWAGPYVVASSFESAQEFCNNRSLGYCMIDGVLSCN